MKQGCLVHASKFDSVCKTLLVPQQPVIPHAAEMQGLLLAPDIEIATGHSGAKPAVNSVHPVEVQ
jgi:hypothetical protein